MRHPKGCAAGPLAGAPVDGDAITALEEGNGPHLRRQGLDLRPGPCHSPQDWGRYEGLAALVIDAGFDVTIAPRSRDWLARLDWTLRLHDDQFGEGAVTFAADAGQFDIEQAP